MKSLSFVFVQLFSAFIADAQLLSGPMLGYVDLRDVAVWAQSTENKPLTLTYWPDGQKLDGISITLQPDSVFGNTLTYLVGNLEPGTKYNYSIGTDKTIYSFTTQTLWQFRTDPPSFKVALGSCAYINEEKYDRPGKPYGGNYEIFTSIAAKKPDLMLWTGDNIYLREGDWNSESGIVHRYTHTRSTKEMQPLLSTCANYAIWDDHDFGPNDSFRNFIHKDRTLAAFKHFWANPSYGLSSDEAGMGVTTAFNWNDIDFFLLDNRYHKSPPEVVGIECSILGDLQIDWLIESLKFSKSPFKIVVMGGQFLNPVNKFENYATCSRERDEIINRIRENGITGVVFISGDRHCTELSKMMLTDQIPVYDLTVSPLTSTAYDNTKEENTLRVDGTLVPERNFATLEFTGLRNERSLTISIFRSSGDLVWTRTIAQTIVEK